MRPIDADKLLQIYRSEKSRMEERQCDRINKANSKSVMLLELECRELEKLSTWIGFCEDIIIDIENTPTIDHYGTWIPASSGKLPNTEKPYKAVLFQLKNSMVVGYTNKAGQWFVDTGDGYCVELNEKPVAWMPLPEPYREEKKDELSRNDKF